MQKETKSFQELSGLIVKINYSANNLKNDIGIDDFRAVDFVNFIDMFAYLKFEDLFLLLLTFNIISNNKNSESGIDIGFYRSGAILRILIDLLKDKEEDIKPIFYYKSIPQRLTEPKLSKINSRIINIYDDSLKTGGTLGSYLNLLMRVTKLKKLKQINIYTMFYHRKYEFDFDDVSYHYYKFINKINFNEPLFYVDYGKFEELKITLSNRAEKLLKEDGFDKERKKENLQSYINRFEKKLSDKDSPEKRKELLEEKQKRLEEVLKNTKEKDFKKYYFPLIFTDPIFVSLICWYFAKKIYKSIETDSKSIVILSTSYEGDILNGITAFFVKKLLQDKDIKIFINKFPHSETGSIPIFFVDYTISTNYLLKSIFENTAYKTYKKTKDDFKNEFREVFLVFNNSRLEENKNNKINAFFPDPITF